eukprot:Lankesteria_metandrocarpae@DN8176_c0_g1_i1.p1
MFGDKAASVYSRYDYCLGDDDDDEAGECETWIHWFLNLEGHEFLIEVEEDYIRDRFNLFGLKSQIVNFEKALSTILSSQPDELNEPGFRELFRDSRDLYGLIHSRFIASPRGLVLMKEKYQRGLFGYCPRVLCDRQFTIPVGLSDQLDEYNVLVYCPKCQESYEVQRGVAIYQADGAYFGSSFPHIFLQSFPNLVPIDAPASYVPKIFGFRVRGKKSIVQVKLEAGEYGDSVRPCPKRNPDSDAISTTRTTTTSLKPITSTTTGTTTGTHAAPASTTTGTTTGTTTSTTTGTTTGTHAAPASTTTGTTTGTTTSTTTGT